MTAAYRVGTRGSKLALWQTEHVLGLLRTAVPKAEFEVVRITTTADRRQDVPLRAIGDKSLFLKEIETALTAGDIDFAVHSLKDVPSQLDDRFVLPAILEREDPRDVLLPGGLAALPAGARVGSSSLRREAQLRALRPDLRFEPVRGNVDTRVRKLQEGQYDGLVLAAAGLKRLGLGVPAEALLGPEQCLPAPGQAAICVETLRSRKDICGLLARIDHPVTRAAVEAERAFAAALDAGCQVPLGAYAWAKAPGTLRLETVILDPGSGRAIRGQAEGINPVALGQRLAREALAGGAGEMLAAARAG